MTFLPNIARRSVLALGLGLGALTMVPAAQAQDVAQSFVQDNINKGMAILNNQGLSAAQKREQFAGFLLTLTDMKRIADFTLGNYRRSASPADLAAFEAAFQNYAVSVYQFYFAKYSGQTLKVVSSQKRAPESNDDFIVTTQLVDPSDRSGRRPLEVNFRVRTDRGKPVVTDVSVEGIWLTINQRAEFTSYLGKSNGNIRSLITHLGELSKQFQ